MKVISWLFKSSNCCCCNPQTGNSFLGSTLQVLYTSFDESDSPRHSHDYRSPSCSTDPTHLQWMRENTIIQCMVPCMEPLNKGYFGDIASVLISEVEVKNIIIIMVKGPGGVSFVGRSSLSRRVLSTVLPYRYQ